MNLTVGPDIIFKSLVGIILFDKIVGPGVILNPDVTFRSPRLLMSVPLYTNVYPQHGITRIDIRSLLRDVIVARKFQ